MRKRGHRLGQAESGYAMTFREIGARIGMTAGGVKYIFDRALRKIQRNRQAVRQLRELARSRDYSEI